MVTKLLPGAPALRDFFRDATAADNRAAFEHERRKPGAREIGCGRQAVMAGADYDRVIFFPRHVLVALWTCAVKAFSTRMTVSQTTVS
jgi:hypothetical protein